MRMDFIVLMLSLNISGTYNNIPYKRLLYICKSIYIGSRRACDKFASTPYLLASVAT